MVCPMCFSIPIVLNMVFPVVFSNQIFSRWGEVAQQLRLSHVPRSMGSWWVGVEIAPIVAIWAQDRVSEKS